MATTHTHLPVYLTGSVVHGAGRGGSQLGFPTANVEASCLQTALKHLDDGVYYGYAKVVGGDETAEPMVMSVGQNITFADAFSKTAEVHILKKYSADFYGSSLKFVVVGYIRQMLKFNGLDELIAAINNDIAIAREKMTSESVSKYQKDPYFDA